MWSRVRAWHIGLVWVAIGAAGWARATTTTYIDPNAFLANINSTKYLETFDSQPYGQVLASPLSFSGNGFSYTASANGGFYNIKNGTTSDIWLSTQGNTVPMTFNFTSGNVTAVGGNFFATDYYGTSQPAEFILVLNDGTTVDRVMQSDSFEGFISSLPISSLSIYPQVDPTFATVNNLYVGTKLPEPTCAAVVILAGAGLLSRRARRRVAR